MPSLPNSGLSIRELDALFDQSPIPMVFGDRELRARRINAAFRRLVGLPDEAILGRRPSEGETGMDTAHRQGAGRARAPADGGVGGVSGEGKVSSAREVSGADAKDHYVR